MKSKVSRRTVVGAVASSTAFSFQGGKNAPVVGIGSLMHESNSFNPAPTTLRDFHVSENTIDEWARGSTEMAGFIEGGRAAGFNLFGSIAAQATPKGPVTSDAFETLTKRLIAGLKKAPKLDAIYLALHGALFTNEYPQGDEEVVRRVREAFGNQIPLYVTHDFHANVSPGIVSLSTVLITYKQNPHLDTKDRGLQAARILARQLKGEIKPRQTIVKPPMLYQIVFQNTFAEPLLPITQDSIELERKNPKVLAASVSGGYQYNDCPYIGPAVVVVTDGDDGLAEREAKRLADRMWATRDRIKLNLPEADRAVANAMKAKKFPVALFDIGDNIGGGSAGDATFLLAELVKQKATGWVMVVYDPAAVRAAKKAGLDGAFDMAVGGKSDKAHGDPVRIRGTVRSLHAGRYVETAVRHGGGRYWDMGHAAVIEAEGSTKDLANYLVVTELRSSPNSIHQLVSLGIYPDRQRILVAKGTIAPRAAYEPVAAEIVMVDTPGATAVNPARYTFKRAPKNLWGLK